MRSDAIRLQIYRVRRHLVIEAEPCAVMADTRQPSFAGDKASRNWGGLWFPPVRQHGRRKRILRERVQHISEQKLLMLLLMLQAQFDQREGLVGHALEQLHHRRIDMTAVGTDALGR